MRGNLRAAIGLFLFFDPFFRSPAFFQTSRSWKIFLQGQTMQVFGTMRRSERLTFGCFDFFGVVLPYQTEKTSESELESLLLWALVFMPGKSSQEYYIPTLLDMTTLKCLDTFGALPPKA